MMCVIGLITDNLNTHYPLNMCFNAYLDMRLYHRPMHAVFAIYYLVKFVCCNCASTAVVLCKNSENRCLQWIFIMHVNFSFTGFPGGIASCSASDSAYCYTFLRSAVCLPVVCHIHACTLLKPFGGLRCHLAGGLVGSMTHCVKFGPWPSIKGEVWGSITHGQNVQLQVSAKTVSPIWCYLANNTNEELGGLAIPLFAKLLWFLL